MANTLSMISKIFLIAAIISFIVAVILFVYFKIPSVIGDLSGRTAKKSIKEMRQVKSKSNDVNKRKRKKLKKSQLNIDEYEIENSQRPETGLLGEENEISIGPATELLGKNTTSLLVDEDRRENSEAMNKEKIQIDIIYEAININTDEYIH